MKYIKDRYKTEIVTALLDKFQYGNVMEVPRLEKIVINRGLGEAVSNSKVVESTLAQLAALTGQKPIVTRAKKSISNFKLREGQAIGCKVTLRNNRMYDFLEKLLKVNLPKIRDFRGVSRHAFDGRGNYNLGIKEDGIFIEYPLEKLDKPRGMHISFVTSAKTDQEAYELLALFGMPFRKN